MPHESSLLREWELLQERIVPPLLELRDGGEPVRVWAVGSVADAVAVAAAFRHAGGKADGFEAYAWEFQRNLAPVAFSLADIRCVPETSRASAFDRKDRKWVPAADLAGQVILDTPREPVHLVTLRATEAGDPDVCDRVVGRLRPGGHLLLTAPAEGLADRSDLKPLGNGLFEKRGVRPGGTVGGPGSPSRVETDETVTAAVTLAQHQIQADLVARHARLARSLARRFNHHGETKDDLEQVALLALVKAARRFDPSRDIAFSTYATASILGELKRHFRDKTWMMRVPRAVQEAYLAVKEARESLTQELACSPTIAQIAHRLGVSDETILEAMEAGENYWPESLDVGLFEGENVRDVPTVEGFYELTLDRHRFAALVPRLAPRERLILKRTYFDGWTQREIAEEVGVSQMQVSRLLARTIERMREWAEE